MFVFAILIGIYSYLILALGLLGILYKSYIILLTITYVLINFYFYRRKLKMNLLRCFKTFKKIQKHYISWIKRNLLFTLLLSILLLQSVINFMGALGPELGFDALWYHLTLPKIYLMKHSVDHIPGGLLYYSNMPKLTEMLYMSALTISNETLAKLIHFSFGILTLIAIYKLSSKFFSQKIALLVVVVFYSNLVVGWQSITAYIDLTRAFFEVMALWGFINWWMKGDRKWLAISAIMLGLAVSTKLLAIGSLLIFIVLIIYRWLHGENKSLKLLARNILLYCFIVISLPLPWFAFSLSHTGSPIYPFFTNIYKVNFDVGLLDPSRFLFDTWNLLTRSPDPISPIYIIFLPLVLIFYKKFRPEMKLVAIYSLLAIVIWYFTSRTGGGRFILPYLPAFSIVVARIVDKMGIYSSSDPPSGGESRSFKVLDFARTINFRLLCIGLIIFVSLISIFYRGFANSRYIPVILGAQTKEEFLSSNLNFSFGDFYDTDGYFKNNIKPTDKVLLYGFHNLYYVDFPFIDSSFVKRGDRFNYIAVQNSILPQRFLMFDLIYSNPKTYVNLYSIGGKKWVY